MYGDQLYVVSYIDDGAIYYARYVVVDRMMTVSSQFGLRTVQVGSKNHQAVARLMLQGMISASPTPLLAGSSHIPASSAVGSW